MSSYAWTCRSDCTYQLSLFYTDNEETYYKLSEAKVCTFYAEFLLRPAGRVGILYFMIFMKLQEIIS